MEFDSSGNYHGTAGTKRLDLPVHRVLHDRITVLTAEELGRLRPRERGVLEHVIDDFGERSAKAQGLGAVITTVRKMLYTDQRLYIHRSERAVNGILKVGRKSLFIRDLQSGKMHEINPVCVLDFYVHESIQRSGVGRQLFEAMLRREALDPSDFGYDRPSPKLLGFLRKHYALVDYDPQPNNFVVFKVYFQKSSQRTPHARGSVRGRRATHSDSAPHPLGEPLAAKPANGGWQPVQAQAQHGIMGGSTHGDWHAHSHGGGAMGVGRHNQLRAPPGGHGGHAEGGGGPPRLGSDARRSPMDPGPADGGNALASTGGAREGSGGGQWRSKLSMLADTSPQADDALAEFARQRQRSAPSGELSMGSGVRLPYSANRDLCRADVHPHGDAGFRGGLMDANARGKGGVYGGRTLQEEASHFVYAAARRPESGRVVGAPLAPHNPPSQAAAGHSWHTANSEIGAWAINKTGRLAASRGGGVSEQHVGGEGVACSKTRGGLALAALNDRRVGGRLW